MNKTIIGVFGDSKASDDEARFAEKLGKNIATRGYILLTGARGGVMKAACKGAKKEGGVTLGILPFTEKSKANKFTDIVIPTGIGSMRNALNALTADYVITIGGGSGTLSEIAYSWMFGKPILGVIGFDGWSERLAGEKVDERREDRIIPIESPREALEWIDEREKQ